MAQRVASKPRVEPLLAEFPGFITRAMRGDYLDLAQPDKIKLAMVSDATP